MRNRLRFLAGFLCVCMLATSQASYVLAAGVSDNSYETEVTVELTESETFPEESRSEETDAQETEGENPKEGSVTETESVSENESTEESSALETETDTGTESVTETEFETESGGAAETESGMESGSETETDREAETGETESETETGTEEDASGNDISGNDISGNDILQGKAVTKSEESYEYELGVDEDGVLYLKSGELGGKHVVIPDGTKKIPKSTDLFYKNNNVEDVTIPTSVEEFEESAFEGAGKLKHVSFQDEMTNAKIFSKKLFADCSSLGSPEDSYEVLTIPYGITTIAEECFSGCGDRLSAVNIPVTVKEIGTKAFSGCSSLQKIKLNAVESIGARAFNGCSSLTGVTFSKDLCKIGERAFAGCDKLKTIDFSQISGKVELSSYAFTNSGVEKVIFSEAFDKVPSYAFSECDKLKTVEIHSFNGKGISLIEKRAFENCGSLEVLSLPECVAEVEQDAFAGCVNLKTIEILNGKDTDDGSSIKLVYDSFPGNNGMKVRGYGGNVEEWAGRHEKEGVVYETLYLSYKIKVSGTGNGSVKTDKTTARIGDTVTITPKPASGMATGRITYGSKDKTVGKNLSFKVTKEDIEGSLDRADSTLTVKAAFIKSGTAVYSNLDVDSESGNLVFSPDAVKGNVYHVTFPSVWASDRLIISDRDKNEEIGSWAWIFESEDSGKVSVSGEGVVRALAQTANAEGVAVTATLKANKNIKIIVHCKVKQDAYVKEITGFQFDDPGHRLTEGSDNGRQVAQYTKAWLDVADKGTRTFDVKVNMVNFREEVMDADFTWSSANTAVAKVGKSKTSGTENTITVCGSGETLITATSAVANKSGDKLSKQFIVRVLDQTPNVQETSITFNPKASDPAKFTLVPSYGGKIKSGGMQLVRRVKGEWVQDKEISVAYTNGEATLRVLADSTYNDGKNRTLSGLYLKGYMEDGDPFYTLMPKISISVKEIKPTVKLTGYINTFYSRDAAEQSQVTAAITAPKGYSLDENYTIELANSSTAEKDKHFTDNFELEEAGDGRTWYIKQKNIQLTEYNDKIVNKGVLKIKCQGFLETKVTITVPVKKAAPAFEISPTKGTANTMASGQKYEIAFRDKKTKTPLLLAEGEDTVSFDLNQSGEYFKKNANRYLKIEGGKIVLTLPTSVPAVTKAVLKVKKKGWSEEVRYTFTINVTKAVPKAVPDSGTIVINKTCYDSNSTGVSLNQTDAVLTGFTAFNSTSKSKAVQEQAEQIKVEWKDDRITATIAEGKNPDMGTYEYVATPQIAFKGTGKTESGSNVKVKVKIVETLPSIKLSGSAFKLNTNLEGLYEEKAEKTFTWQDMPNEGGFSERPDDSEMKILWNDATFTKDQIPAKIEFVQDQSSGSLKMRVSLQNNYTWRKNEVFVLQGLKLENGGGKKVDVSPLRFTVTRVTGAIGIDLKAKGSINVLDADSAITYTPKVKNYAGKVEAVEVGMEVNADGDEQEPSFDAILNDDGKITIKVKESKKDRIEARKYTLYLNVALMGALDGEILEKKISFTPKQVMPKLTLNRSSITLYQSNPAREQEITLIQQAGVKADISGVSWAKGTSDAVKDIYEISAPDQNGTFTIKLKNAAAVKKGTYTLKFVIQCKNQLLNSSGTGFSVKVTVK